MPSIKDQVEARKLKSKQDFLKLRNQILPKIKTKQIKQEYTAKTNSIFVGEYGYPKVNVGILSAEEYNHNDDSKFWIKNHLSISDIAEKRFDLINSRKESEVKQTQDLTEQQEIALAKRPTQVDVKLSKQPQSRYSIDNFNKPMGPSAELQNLKLVENAKIPTKVEKIVSDTDLKSTEGLNILYQKGFNYDYLTQALTSGSLGIKDNRKLVPTKWGITAVDDTVGKSLLNEIKDFQTTGNLAFQGSYLGNYFLVLLLEGNMAYELFEFFRDVAGATTDFENWKGRKNYANETAGGYYAARLPILEWMKENKRQSQALVLRFITDEYYMPLGVWVVRNAVAEAMKQKPIEFGSEELMINFAKAISKKKFNRNLEPFLVQSKLLDERKQKSLDEF